MENVSKENILQLAQIHNVRFVRLQFTDLYGSLKNVEIPTDQLEKALDGKIMFDGSAIHGFVRIEESDMYLYPDLQTWLVLPWTSPEAKVARLICNVYLPDGTPFAGDPRRILQKATQDAATLGFSAFKIGVELEFFLLTLDACGQPTVNPNDTSGYFEIAPSGAGENCRRDIVVTLQEIGFVVAGSHHETAAGQHEIDLQYTDALTAADNVMTLKMVVKTISNQHRLHATFMPKPLQDADGSGMHCHQSLFDGNRNVFYDPDNESILSNTGRSYIAGLLSHAPAITAITNPLVNSYKRLIPDSEAPAYIFWSKKNRMPFVRIPFASGNSTRIEVRSPDGACNPYLAFAVMLKAGLAGIQNHLTPPQPIYKNISMMSEEERFKDGIFPLPTNLEQAIEALETDETICEALGEHAFTHFVRAKELEWEMYRKTVHPWELNQYLQQY